MDIRIDGVNIFNPLEGKLDDIIECMVEFYGEKHRTIIEERLHNSEFFFVPTNGFSSISDDIKDCFAHKKEILLRNLFAQLTSDPSRANLLTNTSIHNLHALKTHKVNLFTCSIINNVLLFLKVFKTSDDKLLEQGITKDHPDYDQFKKHTHSEFMTSRDLTKFMEEHPENWQLIDNFLDQVEQVFRQSEHEFARLEQEESVALQQAMDYDDIVTSISEKHTETMSTFAHEQLSKVIGAEIRRMSPSQLCNLRETYFNLLHFAKDINFLSVHFLSKSTQTEFIKFFNNLGYCLGEDFREYLNLILTLPIFSEQTIAEFEKINKQMTTEQTCNNPIFQECVTRVNQLDLSTGSLKFARSLFQFMNCSFKYNVNAYVLSTITKEEHQLKNLVVLPWAINSSDTPTMHELGHVIENMLLSVNKKTFTIISGFDTMVVSCKQEQYTGENLDSDIEQQPFALRPYMAINEVINQYFAVEVVKIMHKRGVQINLGRCINKDTSLYSNVFLLIKDFIEEYKDILIDCRISGDPYAFAQFIGEENFESLAECCSEYLNHAKTSIKIIKFNMLVKKAELETGSPFQQILHSYNWPEDVSELIELHKKVAQIMDNIKSSNIKPEE